MKTPYFVYKDIEYSYVMIDGEPVPYKTHMKMYDEYVLDTNMQKEIDTQVELFEDSLTAEEMKVWLEEEP